MRAFLVLGPESSGTKLMTRLLISAGCVGDDGDEQRWDVSVPKDELIVWRRSLPHGGKWPNVTEIASQLVEQGYRVTLILMSRDWTSISQSQVRIGHTANVQSALVNVHKAYSILFSALSIADYPFEIVNYESLIKPGAVVALMDRLGLSLGKTVEVYDGDAKYYDLVSA